MPKAPVIPTRIHPEKLVSVRAALNLPPEATNSHVIRAALDHVIDSAAEEVLIDAWADRTPNE